MIRTLVMFIVLTVNMVLQSTLFSYIEILNIKPNTAILIIISYAILRGDIEGSIIGFCCGLLQDIFFGRYIGLYALLGFFLGFLCGKPFKDFYRENYLIPLVMTALCTFLYEFMFYFTSFLFRGKTDFFFYLHSIILPEIVYTTILAIPVYRIIYFINLRVESHEKRTRKLF